MAKGDFKPLLAVNVDFEKLKYPVMASGKLDGIRTIVKDGKILSRTLKPIPNKFIQKTLSEIFNDCKFNVLTGDHNYIFDGEIIVGNTFQDTSSAVMAFDGEPDFKYYIFDVIVDNDPDMPFESRMFSLVNWYATYGINHKSLVRWLSVPLFNEEDLQSYEEKCLSEGLEGVILRSQYGKYKFGRSTVNDGIMLKVKRFQDSDAKIIGFEELQHNANEAKTDNLGYTDRATCKENLIGMNTLGALKVKEGDMEFNIGTGFTADQRKHIWDNRDNYVGKLVVYKFQPHGVKDLPRCPVFKGFRDVIDL